MLVQTAQPASYYTGRLEDPKAVYVAGPGGSDDAATLQRAINQVQETTGQGIVFLPSGRYTITNTVYIWPAIRVIGYGPTRPIIALPANTAGFQDSSHERVMIFFAGARPRGGQGRPSNSGDDQRPVPDATPGTFYSALSNIDVEVEDGNSGAVAVRARYAQHCFLAHMDFRLGSALAAIHEGGNVVEDVHFFGGRHAIWTSKPSPGWQFTVIDSSFESQREAAILEREAGLTLIRPHFTHVPSAVVIEEGWADELWIKDASFEDVAGPAIVTGVENNPRNEINLEGATCLRVPVFAALRESGRQFISPANAYTVKIFSHGLHYSDVGATPHVENVFEAAPATTTPPTIVSDLRPLPAQNTWANMRELGAKGDGNTDDTEVLQKAITSHKTLYLPSGFYVVRNTLMLKSDTTLVGLHPGATQLILPDDAPGYQGVGGPRRFWRRLWVEAT